VRAIFKRFALPYLQNRSNLPLTACRPPFQKAPQVKTIPETLPPRRRARIL